MGTCLFKTRLSTIQNLIAVKPRFRCKHETFETFETFETKYCADSYEDAPTFK